MRLGTGRHRLSNSFSNVRLALRLQESMKAMEKQISNVVYLHPNEDLVRRRCRVSAPHARVVCELNGIKTDDTFTPIGEIIETALARLAALKQGAR